MIFSVLYPNHAGARFDADYYRATHVALVEEIWAPARVDVIEGLPGVDGAAPPFALIAHIHFASPEAMQQALGSPRGGELQADVAKFTDIVPVAMMGRGAA